MKAVVFTVCKGVTLHDRGTGGGKYLRLSLAPIVCALGEVDMTKSLWVHVSTDKGRKYLSALLSSTGMTRPRRWNPGWEKTLRTCGTLWRGLC